MKYYLEKVPHSIVFATSVGALYDNHRIHFDGSNIGAGHTRHTSLDWFLSPKERPSIEKASVKEHYIDIPGSNGGLDLTESLTGFPLYEFIEGEFEFTILNDKVIPILENGEVTKEVTISWEVLNRDIRDFLNGKKMYMMLEDDPSWYYYGRFGVEKYDSSDNSYSKIKITYKVYPYKRMSKYKEDNTFNSYFDALSLTSNELNPIYRSFWAKEEIILRPKTLLYPEYKGSVEGQLPCGREPVSVEFRVLKESNAFNPKIEYTGPNGNVIADIVTEASAEAKSTRVRGVNLSNITDKNKTILYSDNTLKITLPFPLTYDTSESGYKKGDCISYISTQSTFKWILKANEAIAKEAIFDLTKWDVDEGAMDAEEYTNKEYQTGAHVYIKNSSSIMLYNAIAEVPSGVSPESDTDHEYWDTDTSIFTELAVYKPVKLTIDYDIGVM